jgi:hypothetical protein
MCVPSPTGYGVPINSPAFEFKKKTHLHWKWDLICSGGLTLLAILAQLFFFDRSPGGAETLPPEYFPLITKDRAEKPLFSRFYIRG